MSRHDPINPAALAEQFEWVRTLARALVANEAEAEDLAQDAWIAALTRQPRGVQSWRHWMGAVMRNLARSRWRARAHRDAREREAARPERVPPEGELLERFELYEELVRAVRALPEPYRTAILLRYFDGLSPVAIAERTGTPLRTVHTHLHRGLQRLGESLDRLHGGDRQSWMALLVPFSRTGIGVSAGALIMSTKLKLSLAAIVVAASLGGLFLVADVRPEGPADDGAVAEVRTTGAPAELSESSMAELAVAVTAEGASRHPERWGGRLDGHVRDAESDLPLAGAEVEIRQAHPAGGLVPGRVATTDEAGNFAFEAVRDDELRLLVRAPRHRPLVETLPGPSTGLDLRLEPFSGALEGQVTAIEGIPLVDARVHVQDAEQGFAEDVATDAAGVYRVEGVPDTGTAELVVRASAPGRQSAARRLAPLEPGEVRRVDFEPPLGRALGTIEVVSADGEPIAGACILFCDSPDRSRPLPRWETPWVEVARTGTDGRATVAGLPLEACTLSIRAEGHLEEHRPLEPQTDSAPAGGFRLRVVLQPRGRLIGLLIDAEGAPIRGRLLFRRASWPAARWHHVERARDAHQVWSDADGGFSVDALVPATPYHLVLDAPGHATTAVEREVAVAPGEELDLGRLQLQRGRTVAGLVRLDPGTSGGGSVRLGAVGVLQHDQIMTWRPVRIAEDGRFEALAMPLGAFTLRGAVGSIEREVVVLPGQEHAELDLRNDAALAWTLTARCVDLTGGPVDGVPLVARGLGGEPDAPLAPLAPTGVPGLYELRDVHGLLRLIALAPESEFLSLDPETRVASSSPSTTLRVELAGRVTGRVVAGDSGRPIAGAGVVWRLDAGGATEGGAVVELRARCDAGGEFALDVPATRFGELTASAPGFLNESMALPPIGRTGTRWDAALRRAGRLVVEARTDDGAPLANARILCSGPKGADAVSEMLERQTDALGLATFDLARAGRYRVEIAWGAYNEYRDVVVGGAAGEIRVRFESAPPGVDVRVRIYDTDGSIAVERTVILADLHELRSAPTGSDGIARFEAVAPGDYTLRVPEPDGSLQGWSVLVPPGSPLELTFRLE